VVGDCDGEDRVLVDGEELRDMLAFPPELELELAWELEWEWPWPWPLARADVGASTSDRHMAAVVAVRMIS
tara:strand:- start:175 stop:387 length:213 start_codon:yes stop_codon:yes gene_type:complete